MDSNNATQPECIHQLFAAQVARTPDAVALEFAQQTLTYRQLDARTNQLAHHLQNLGVGPEVLVGLCIERSPDLIIGLLGILKAGGAYVPLDPAYPAERLRYMLKDAAVPVLVTQAKVAQALPAASAKVICVDTEPALLQVARDTLPASPLSARNAAYVIYTSGSTGQPKGVVIEHRGVCSLARSLAQWFSPQPDSRVLQFASVSFDAAVWELVMALTTGARLVLGTADSLLPGANLLQTLRQYRITHLTLPPSVLAALPVEALPDLQTLIVAGEVCPVDLVQKWAPGRAFFNAYGPTEATVCATLMQVRDYDRKPPIGHPIAGAQVYILDSERQPVSVGVSGELYLGGVGLARGYLNRPELTQERFIAHPFSDQCGERLYKTGDQARYLADGSIEFLGRLDSQVKLRGFRIELGEIEAVLRQYPGIRESAVLLREDQPGNQRLVAYLVAVPSLGDESALRDFLRQKLPQHMLPAAFVQLDAMPLTPNGKLDHRSLPAPALTRTEHEPAFVAPRTATEMKLASIWSEVLGVAPIGADDNFYTLGGHSLTAGRLLSRVQDQLQVRLPIATIFAHPTVAALAHEIDALTQTGAAPPRPELQRVARHGQLPVSFAQERVYFIQQVAPDSTAYQAQATLRFSGNLDVTALQHSLSEMIRRHEIFRTTFPAVDGRLVQQIHAPPPVHVPLVDLQQVPAQLLNDEVQRLIQKEVHKPFDLNQLPLVRWTLLKLAPTEHLLIHIEHHMVHDGWSFNLFLHELLVIYQARLQALPSPLPEPSLQFADFAHWQRQWTASPEAHAQLTYWQKKLAGAPPFLALPTDRPRPTEQTYRGEQLRINLPAELCTALWTLCRKEQASLFMTMLAGFLVLLQRYTGQEDLVVGSAVANRGSRATEGLIGMIVNNLVLRTTLAGNPTFRALLAQVRQVTLEGYANEDLPFDKVVEALKPARDLSYNPVFQVMFSFHDSPLPARELPGLRISNEIALSNQTSKFDLDVVAIPHAGQRTAHTAGEQGVSMIWEYNSDLFDRATVQRMEEQYQTLLAAAVAQPSTRIAELPLLTAAQVQWLTEWNGLQLAFPAERGVHELIAEQVARTPDAVAVDSGSAQLTYRELDGRANQLAHALQAQGIGPESLVGLCIERSLDMVVAILGILKAGGAYVPIDPAYPDERIAYILQDTKLRILLTQASLRERFAGQTVTLLSLDTDWDAVTRYSTAAPVSAAGPHNLAYIIYTSGSTGKPKGVMIEQRSLTNFAKTASYSYCITAQDRILQFASISFDTAVEEIYPCLINGATLLLRSEAMLHTSDDFWRTCRQWGVTVLNFPTAFWHQLTAELGPRDGRVPEHVRLVIIGGEEAQLEKVRRWHQGVAHLNPPPQLYNGYGPTEGTVTTTLHHCEPTETGVVPIGLPLPNAQVYLLDRHQSVVPVGATGELHIGGVGLARGYLHQPALTAEKFIQLSVLGSTAIRLYRTGDLARLRADGNLEYLGRLDDQVKIRGFRIELGEIETVLSQHPQVRQALVVVRKDGPDNKRLVAYVVAKSPSPGTEELRRYLLQKLPSYMVPSAFVNLTALPLTPSGKVALDALPAPDFLAADPSAAPAAPSTPTEKILLAIWSEILRTPRAGIHDNFFELGGDSILSIQVVARARQAGLHLTPKQIFHNQTVAALAAVVDATISTLRAVPAEQGLVTGPVPLIPIQRWFFAQQFVEPHYFNQSALLATPPGLDPKQVQQVVQHLLLHHDALRLRYVSNNNQVVQESRQAEPSSVCDIIDLSDLPATAQPAAMAVTEANLQRSLNLMDGPLIRVALFQLGADQPGYLLFIVHHLAVDGVSWRILLEDFATAYQQLGQGAKLQLPAKTTSFKEWADRLADYARAPLLAAEMEHWTQVIRDVNALPLDFPAGHADNTVSSAATVTLALSAEDTRTLLQDVPAAYNTQINDVLLTTLAQSLAPWTGAHALLVDLEGHGREDLFEVDLSRTVGWFTTLYPVRLELAAEDLPGASLKSIKEQLRQIPRRGIGYGVLRYLSGTDAGNTLQALPQAELTFNYLGQVDQVFSASTTVGAVREWKLAQSPLNRRSHVLDVGCLIRAGQLETTWTFSTALHRRDTVERVTADFLAALKALITHCCAPEAGGYTPSDFSAVQIDQKRLDKLMNKIKRPKQESAR